MSKKILGLDLGSNSVGWALLEQKDGQVNKIIDIGSRIFNKAVGEETVPTPKNKKRRDMRLGRRVLQRRARRKQKMLNYLLSLELLPQELNNNFGQEKLLNELGNPYELRTRGLDEALSPHEFGRVLLHFVARRGFLSNKKQIAGDLVDDPDTMEFLKELEKKEKQKREDKEAKLLVQGKTQKPAKGDQSEEAFKADIGGVYKAIKGNKCRTLGEYLYKKDNGEVKRNRSHAGGHLRTERAMYQNELEQIWQKQKCYFSHLPDDFMADNKGVKEIIFYQRPLKLKKDRVEKCSLEPKSYRANMARLEVQKFRYLQDINNLKYFERHSEQWLDLCEDQKDHLRIYFEHNAKITVTNLKQKLDLDKPTKINLETKNLKGNITACEIRAVIESQWDEMSDDKQKSLFEDLFTIKKKSALKKRLITHWGFDIQTAIKLCLLEFEPSHSNHSLKAINKLLPFLEQGMVYSDARQAAGYDYEVEGIEVQNKLSAPPETANPIVNKGLHELRRVVNAIIKQYGKPDIVRIEMARDLEMNTTRYKENEKRQAKNKKENEDAVTKYQEQNLGKYPSYDDKIKYRLWKEQKECCAYSNRNIPQVQVFSADTEIDHILPFAKSLDDSYMNKVLCFTSENRDKSDRTPFDAWSGNKEKWNQITQAVDRWDKSLQSKIDRFYQKESDTNWNDADFAGSQLTDTRYISKLARDYVCQLGCDVNVTKGAVVSQIRHQWGFNSLLGETDKKERTDHRHHAIDAVVIASTSRSLYTKAVTQIQQNKLKINPPYARIRDDLEEKLKDIIVSHTPQRKLSGSLHEETGANYIEKHRGLVYRKSLNDPKLNPSKIVDESVKKIILEHISKYNTAKEAFAAGIVVYHKDGKTPIKRVRVSQSDIKTTKNKTAQDILAQKKFAVKDKSGKVFKYMSYGNIHHVEIIKNNETGKTKGEFVTMMAASHRAKGINIPKQPIIKTDHGEGWEFIMALHINDMVSVEKSDGKRAFYRVQKLNPTLMLRLATAATLTKKEEEIHISINKDNFKKHEIQLHRVNAIGHFIND